MEKVLVAVDGSEQSLAMVDYTANILSPEKTELVLYHVFNKIPESYWDLKRESGYDLLMEKLKEYEDKHSTEINELLEEARKKYVEMGYRENHVHLMIQERRKGIARDIIDESREGYGSLLMGRLGLAKSKDPALGSVTAKVVSALPDVHIGVVTGHPETSKGIVALDGSEGSMKSVDFLGSLLGGRHDFEVTLFHAMRRLGYPTITSSQNNILAEVEKEIWDEDRKVIEPTMEDAKSRLVEKGFKPDKVKTKIVTGVASRAGALLEEAYSNKIGSIFVGRTGVSQVEEFNIGRVTNKVIHRAENMAVWIAA